MREVPTQLFRRQRDVEHDANQVWVVATAEQRSDPGYSDLQMTRSICDWAASDVRPPATVFAPLLLLLRMCHSILQYGGCL